MVSDEPCMYRSQSSRSWIFPLEKSKEGTGRKEVATRTECCVISKHAEIALSLQEGTVPRGHAAGQSKVDQQQTPHQPFHDLPTDGPGPKSAGRNRFKSPYVDQSPLDTGRGSASCRTVDTARTRTTARTRRVASYGGYAPRRRRSCWRGCIDRGSSGFERHK